MRALAALLLAAGMLTTAAPARADHAPYGVVLTIDAESARGLLARGGVSPIDLRPEPAFRRGRLPGARSVPLATLAARPAEVMNELPHGGVLVLYGEGPAAQILAAYHVLRSRHAGDVYVLEGGWEAWQRLGYRVER